MLTKKYFKTKDECEVTFELEASDAQEVALVSEANDWEPLTMKKARDGAFRAKIRLPKGSQFQFRYLVDNDSWHNDEAADAYWPNEYGSQNSVVSTTAD